MGIKIKDGEIEIDVHLNNGAYLLDNVSGTGKSYLYYLLRTCMTSGCMVWALTYDDIIQDGGVENVNIPDDMELYLFDRYGAYYGEFDNKIKELSEHSIVLVDCKLPIKYDIARTACSLLVLDDKKIDIAGWLI